MRSQNLTLHNTGGATLTGIALTFAGPYGRLDTGAFPGGAPDCGTTLAAGANCTIKVVFSPTALGSAPGSVAIAASVAVTGSPVTLSGTGVAQVLSATLTPTSRNFGTVTRGSLAGGMQAFMLTNTGNVPLTGITQGALGGTDAVEFTVIRFLSTCGPAGGGQFLGQTTLAPGAVCAVTVQFRPLTTQSTGAKSGHGLGDEPLGDADLDPDGDCKLARGAPGWEAAMLPAAQAASSIGTGKSADGTSRR